MSRALQIYIIDDEPSICIAYERLARSANMKAQCFSNVDDFLAADVPLESACLVSDVCMPGTSVFELPALLARSGHAIPIIFVTAHDSEETLARAQKAGAAGYFRKPVDGDALLDFVKWVVANQGHS